MSGNDKVEIDKVRNDKVEICIMSAGRRRVFTIIADNDGLHIKSEQRMTITPEAVNAVTINHEGE